ncbi:MAG: LamG domain-containing protein [Planctomycetes bacterium]|jgi:hypothetical protein|nr:LamG domain-containing protein [Planctomycetota bacterium]
MTVVKRRCGRLAVAGVMIVLMGWGTAQAGQDQFLVQLGGAGEIVRGDGTGFNRGSWYYYPDSDRLAQWFSPDAMRDSRSAIAVDLTIALADGKPATGGTVEVSVGWSRQGWAGDRDCPPLPDLKNPSQERRDIESRTIVSRMEVGQTTSFNIGFEIAEFCPLWIAVGVRGQNVRVEGRVRHDSVPTGDPVPPAEDRDPGAIGLRCVKWSQPPLELDPTAKERTYSGWCTPAYAARPSGSATASWTLLADDFRCSGVMPVTSVRWWGAYQAWDGAQAPRHGPESWRLGFWSHAPADARYPFPRPDRLLWTIEAPAARVEEKVAGAGGFLDQARGAVFEYQLELQPQEQFRQDRFADSDTRDRIFWLSITPLYTGTSAVQNPWCWQTRPAPWGGGAVEGAFRGDDLRAGFAFDPSSARPISGVSTSARRDARDLAFELDAAPEYLHCDQSFTGLRQWAHYEDEESLGLEHRKPAGGTILRRMVADDWTCRSEAPVTGLAWWGSYLGYAYLPGDGPTLTGPAQTPMTAPRPPDGFLLSLWTDEPGLKTKDAQSVSRPGRKIWEYQAEKFDEVLVGFDRNPDPTSSIVPGFEPVYRYSVSLPPDRWFRPAGPGSIYWLSMVAVYRDIKNIVYPWGWTNHPSVSWDRQTPVPLAWWKLDETTGRRAADSAGAHHGTIAGNPTWRPAGGWSGGALDLDGRGDYIRVEQPQGFDFAPNSFSVSAWIYPRQARGSWHTILEYDREGVNRNRFGLWLDPEGRFHFRVGFNTWHSQQSLLPDQWHHVAAVYDAEAMAMCLYVNAVLDGVALEPKGFAAPHLGTLIIGARGSADSEYFNGLLDDVRVFTVALTAEEMLLLAGAGPNAGAVAARSSTGGAADAWDWTLLLDRTGQAPDMSFTLFTQPAGPADAQVFHSTDPNDGSVEIVIPLGRKKG